MILLCVKKVFLDFKGFSTKKEYGSTVQFLYILMKSLQLMSDE